MGEVKWKQISVKQASRRSGEVFASVGQGRISLSAAACGLLDNVDELKFVEAHYGSENGKATKIGLRFSEAKTPNSLNVYRSKYKGKYVGGLNVNSRALIAEFFGKLKDNKSTRHPVEKVNKDMLAIDITKEV